MLRTSSFTLVALLLAGGACSKQEQQVAAPEAPVAPAEPPPPAEAAPEPAPAPDPAAQAEAEKKRQEAEEMAQALKEIEQEAEVEAQRWNDELRAKVTALTGKKFKNSRAALKAILASPHRVPGRSDRDRYRHPVETLTFFGIKPNMTVVEVGVGEGWYTELLAPLLAREGKLIITSPDPNGPPNTGRTVYGKRTQLMLAKSPELFGKVQVSIVNPPEQLELGPAGSADLVITIREMHNWQRRGAIDAYLTAIHTVLKDGGKFGVVAHRAAPGGKAEETAQKGYLPEEWLVQKIESAGFKLEKKSEVNANPKDTKDYEKGVWTLPPNFADGEKDKEKYIAIGESDRMTLRFVKLAAK